MIFFHVLNPAHSNVTQANHIQLLVNIKLKQNYGGWDKTHSTVAPERKSKNFDLEKLFI